LFFYYLFFLVHNSVSVAADKSNFGSENVGITSVTMRSSSFEGGSVLDYNLVFQFKLSHPDYNIISVNENKSEIKGIYIYDKPPKNILKSSVQKGDINKVKNGICVGPACDNEKIDYFNKNSDLYITYYNKKLDINSIRNLWINANFYVLAADRDIGLEEEKIDYITLKDDAPNNIKQNELSFSLINNGTTLGGDMVGFNIVNLNKHIKSIGALEESGEFVNFEPNGAVGKQAVWVNKKYLQDSITLQVKFYSLEEHKVQVNQYLLSN
jgi:hypothetical protein